MRMEKGVALSCYGLAVLLLILGVTVAFARFPGGYDWAYTVVSKLASSRQNPDGARWLAGTLVLAVGLLWPVSGYLGRAHARDGTLPRLSFGVLRAGLAGGTLLGLEGLLVLEFSRHLDKAHEALALVTFLGLYGGVLGLYLHRVRETAAFLLPALLVVLPLCAVGVTQLLLYFDQRSLGWVTPDWREMGIPIWLSFAFWQWLAVVLLGVGFGILVALARGKPSAGVRREPTVKEG